MAHTEIVHVYFGVTLALLGVTAALAWQLGSPVLHATWALLAVGIGFMLFIPVEDQSCSYVQYGWGKVLAGVPPYGIRAWVAELSKIHVLQHKLGGLLTMVIGAIEVGRAARWLTRPVWARLLPWFSIAIGLTLGIHGGTSEHLPYGTEVVHHWILGGCFVLGGMLLAAHQADRLRGTLWPHAWAALLVVAGLDLALLYRLPPAGRVTAPDCSVQNPVGAPQHLHRVGAHR